MAAEVSSSSSSLVRVLSGQQQHIEEQPQIHAGNSDLLITKDLLGSLSKAASTKEIDLEFKNQRCSSSPKSSLSPSSSATSSPDEKSNKKPLPNWVQDSKLKFMEDMASLDLNLQFSSTPSHYQSVCTLDKVKNALERAEKGTTKKRSPPSSSSSSSSTITSGIMFAAACPGCLFYVMASKTNPKCPRCNSFVPFAMDAIKKKFKIDLNASF